MGLPMTLPKPLVPFSMDPDLVQSSKPLQLQSYD
jgi:hypothetical protein